MTRATPATPATRSSTTTRGVTPGPSGPTPARRAALRAGPDHPCACPARLVLADADPGRGLADLLADTLAGRDGGGRIVLRVECTCASAAPGTGTDHADPRPAAAQRARRSSSAGTP